MTNRRTKIVHVVVWACYILLVSGCYSGDSAPPGDDAWRGHSDATYDVAPAEESLSKLETAVLAEGHQPWRLDPLSVAKAELLAVLRQHFPNMEKSEGTRLDNDRLWHVSGGAVKKEAEWQGGIAQATIGLQNTRQDGKGIWYATIVTLKRP